MMYKFGMCFFGISMSIIVVGSIALVHGSTFLPSMILHFANTCKQRYPKEQINSSENKSAVLCKPTDMKNLSLSISQEIPAY